MVHMNVFILNCKLILINSFLAKFVFESVFSVDRFVCKSYPPLCISILYFMIRPDSIDLLLLGSYLNTFERVERDKK